MPQSGMHGLTLHVFIHRGTIYDGFIVMCWNHWLRQMVPILQLGGKVWTWLVCTSRVWPINGDDQLIVLAESPRPLLPHSYYGKPARQPETGPPL